MSVLVTCPNGHRFPVNLGKHLNRAERYCPRCKQPVRVRSRFWFTPNEDWLAKKEGYRNAAEKKRSQREVAERLTEFFGMLTGKRRRTIPACSAHFIRNATINSAKNIQIRLGQTQ